MSKATNIYAGIIVGAIFIFFVIVPAFNAHSFVGNEIVDAEELRLNFYSDGWEGSTVVDKVPFSYTGFMLAVLASNLFWAGYGLASLIAAIIILREYDKGSIIEIFKKWKTEEVDAGDRAIAPVAVIYTMLIWPLVVLYYLLKYFFIATWWCFTEGMLFLVLAIDKVVPTVSVRINKKREE